MDLDLSPKLPKKVYGGNGGCYLAWDPSDLPMLKAGNIGAGKLALEKNGFALPCYSDSAKVAYVLQGIYSSSSLRLISTFLCATLCGTERHLPVPILPYRLSVPFVSSSAPTFCKIAFCCVNRSFHPGV